MGFSLSPAVIVREYDLTLTIPAIPTTIGGIVGKFPWGPCEEITLIDSEQNLVKTFSEPDDNTFADWFSAANFLAYSNQLKVVRVIDNASALNAGLAVTVTAGTPDTLEENVAGNVGFLIKNATHLESVQTSFDATALGFVAKYPGEYGNGLTVAMINDQGWALWAALTANQNTTDDMKLSIVDAFDFAPEGKEVWVAVLLNGDIVETFQGSTDSTAVDPRGGTYYIIEVINRASRYIWANYQNLFGAIDVEVDIVDILGNMSAGVASSTTVDDADYQGGWALFQDDEWIDVNLLIQGAATPTTGDWIIDNVAETRKDCVAFVSPQQADVVNNATPSDDIITTRQTYGSSTYAVMDGNYKYQYDRYNDKYRWVPLNGDVAGLCAHTDYVRDPWWSPGGYNRGKIKNVVKLGWNPSKAYRDTIYKDAINPIFISRGEGPVMLGDKTLQTRPSAFSFINVRRLFIVLEKAISTAAKYMLFEFNDRITRSNFVNMVDPYLRDVKARRGIYDYRVICDKTNNTGEVIDRAEFVADIYIKPARSINVIYLNFVAVKTGVTFEEVLLTNENFLTQPVQ